MSRRSRAREIVLQMLFQNDLNPDTPRSDQERFMAIRLKGDRQLIEFARQLMDGVCQHRDQLDQQLAKAAENWKLTRMANTDRNVLRIGAYEVLYSDTPDRVAINEAINLSKRYGSNNSSQFVNGILDRLMRSKSDQPGNGDLVEGCDGLADAN
jgi:N utilization substance protein B